MLVTRPPYPALRPFVKTMWVSEHVPDAAADRELVLPTGGMHLVVRLSPEPLRLYRGPDDADPARPVAHAVVGGARAGPYVRDVSGAAYTVGAQFHPGAAHLLLGVPAGELAGRHTPLADLWGAAAGEARERLQEAGRPDRQLDVLEGLLAERLPRVRGLHPAVAHALFRFSACSDVGEVVAEIGWSHRRFIDIFHRAVGLTPKRYARVARFQRVLDLLAGEQPPSWVEVALAAGYADQPHFTREFRQLAGVSPGGYRASAPSAPHHVPVGSPGQIRSRPGEPATPR